MSEHGIWALVSSSGLSPAGLLLCTVNSTNGGGETPIAAGHGVTSSGQPCPGGGALPKGSALPTWYVATGLTQGPNVQAANACNGFPSGPNSCYVYTDSGTYDYLASGTDPAGAIPALKVVSRDNSANAPGGANELVNYFHGYIINPDKPNQQINLPAAKDFIAYITSPAVQAQVGQYLASAAGGAPFKPTASPIVTTSRIPSAFFAKSGKKVTVSGTLTDAQPGYPVLSSQPVSIAMISRRRAGCRRDRQDEQPGQVQHQLRTARDRLVSGDHVSDLADRRFDPQSAVRQPALTRRDDACQDHGA